MKAEFTAIVKRDGHWWIGWIEEVPGANAQERTKDALLVSLREAARDILSIHRESALLEAEKDFEEVPLII
jgi:hypothetical protein